ncbi:integrase core domain-containing protein, partial [Corynebacterium diphtheriae]|uniref:integrase core domain-containing protein n=1 Tax=Corynebacterium diphtheriae TaxID=1717 RepID=UPI001FD05994
SLDFEPQPKSSMNNYNQFKTTVLQPPIESKVYTSQAFRDHCAQLGVRQSMGAVGTSADNALAESFNATLKREVLRDRKVFDNPIICRQEVFRWCMRYNTRRRHSWCNLLAPNDFEALTSATLTQAA